jgi:hypothetical protein
VVRGRAGASKLWYEHPRTLGTRHRFRLALLFLRNAVRLRGLLTLAAIATLFEFFGHEWCGGELRCPHVGAQYVLSFRTRRKGKRNFELRVRTCKDCDLGAWC